MTATQSDEWYRIGFRKAGVAAEAALNKADRATFGRGEPTPITEELLSRCAEPPAGGWVEWLLAVDGRGPVTGKELEELAAGMAAGAAEWLAEATAYYRGRRSAEAAGLDLSTSTARGVAADWLEDRGDDAAAAELRTY